MNAMTPAERQRRSRAARAKQGGKPIHVVLSPEATAKLEAWQQRHGLTAAETLEKLLLRSKPAG